MVRTCKWSQNKIWLLHQTINNNIQHAKLLTHLVWIDIDWFCIEHIHLAAFLHQLSYTSHLLLLLLFVINHLAFGGPSRFFLFELINHFAKFISSFIGLSSKLRICWIKCRDILEQLLACFVSTIEFLLKAASIADCENVFLLDFECTLWVFALATQHIFVDKPIENKIKLRIRLMSN